MPALRACLAILVLRDETDRAVARPPTLSAFPDSCRLATRFGRHPGRGQALAPRGCRHLLMVGVGTDRATVRRTSNRAPRAQQSHRRECWPWLRTRTLPSRTRARPKRVSQRRAIADASSGRSGRGIGRGLAGRPCRQPRVDGPGAGAAGRSGGGRAQALPHSRLGSDGALGLLQAASRCRRWSRSIRRLRDHRDAHPSRQ